MSRLRAALAVGLLLSACHGEPAPVGPEPLAEAGEPLLLEVGELAELDGGASEHAVAYRWSFGDGESADGERVSHAWAEPGHWTAVLQVESADGRTATDSVRIDVVWPLAEERPVSARALSFDASGERIYAVLPDFDAVAVVERSTGELLGHLEVCDEPLSVSSAELLDRIVVACRGGNAFEVWQDGSRIVSAEMTDPGAPPLAAVMDEAGEWVFVVHGGLGAVSGWELSPVVTERWRRTDLPDSRGLARVGDQLLVSRFRSSGEGGRLWSFSTDPEVQDLVQVTLAPDPGPDTHA